MPAIDRPRRKTAYRRSSGSDTADYYIKNLPDDQAYDITGANDFNALEIRTNSLYGGYDDDWLRDVDGNRTLIVGGSRAIRYVFVNEPTTVSGLDLMAQTVSENTSRETVVAIEVAGGSSMLSVLSNTLTAADAAPEGLRNFSGSSTALRVHSMDAIEVIGNMLIAGNGGFAEDETFPGSPGGNGAAGSHAGTGGNENGGSGGVGNSFLRGGDGGDRSLSKHEGSLLPDARGTTRGL